MQGNGTRRGLFRVLPALLVAAWSLPHAAPAGVDLGPVQRAGKAPGDSVFSGLQVHIVNLKFDRPWGEVEPVLKANKQAEVYIPASVELNCIPEGHPGCVRMDSVGVRFKGNSTFSQNRAKNPFRFSFDEYGSDRRWDGLKGFTLNNAWSDPSHMNEKIHLDLAREMGMAAPRANFAWLYVNDTLFSFYSLVELADKRLLESRFGEKDGDLFKANDLVGGGQASDFVRRSPYDASAYLGRFENKSDSVERAWNRLVRFIDTLNLAADIVSALPRIAHVNALYKAFAADNLFGNADSYVQSAQNYLIYFPAAGGPMEWILWDVSLSLGAKYSTRSLTAANANRPLANRIFDTPALREDYLRAMWFQYNAWFAGDWLDRRIDSVAAFIRPHVAADPRKLSTLAAFESDLDTLKIFLANRRKYVEGPNGFPAPANGGIGPANAIRNGDILINEIAPAQGWVEVRNARTYSIDLAGHSLSDDPANPDRWTFPLGSFVEPGGFRVIALKGGSPGESGPADFALSPAGGTLLLSRADGTPVDSVGFGAQKGDRTHARFGEVFGIGTATPGLPNTDAGNPVSAPPVVINEFMADNDTLSAQAGMKADWIELYNTTASEVKLDGMYLSDNRNDPAKWRFPAGAAIPAKGRLVVWAYDTTSPGSLHASWSLARGGEHIRLSNADLGVADSVTFGEQEKNRTMARIPDGTGPFRSSCLPTLGTANAGACRAAGLVRGPQREGGRLALMRTGPGRLAARFALAAAGPVRLTVHDLQGRERARPADGVLPAGPHEIVFDTAALPAGIYTFRLRSAGAGEALALVLAR